MFAGLTRKATVFVTPGELEVQIVQRAQAVCLSLGLSADGVYYDEGLQAAKLQLASHVLANQELVNSLARIPGCAVSYVDDPTNPGHGRGVLSVTKAPSAFFSAWTRIAICAGLIAATSYSCAWYLTGDSFTGLLGRYWPIFEKMGFLPTSPV